MQGASYIYRYILAPIRKKYAEKLKKSSYFFLLFKILFVVLRTTNKKEILK